MLFFRKKESAAETLREHREELSRLELEADEKRDAAKQGDGEEVLKGEEVSEAGGGEEVLKGEEVGEAGDGAGIKSPARLY